MLLSFTVKNFKTFKEAATLSLIASNYDKETLKEGNTYTEPTFGICILKSAVVFGANASGKSKLIEALAFMRNYVLESSKDKSKDDPIDVQPFLLNTETEDAPSEFEINFLHQNVLYRYGFEVTSKKVISEWLYYREKTKEVELFYREGNQFNIHKRNFTKAGIIIKEGLVRDNALMVSVATQFNDATCTQVNDWFEKLKVISGINDIGYLGYSLRKVKDEHSKSKILSMLKAADLGIHDITLKKMDIHSLPKDLPEEIKEDLRKEMIEKNREFISDLLTSHRKYDALRNPKGNTSFLLDDHESEGTRKLFALTGPILNVIENGYTLVVDELDSKLHPNLVCHIVSLFNSSKTNPHNAQLLFNTHDTHLLGSHLFRRDQIWFVQKNRYQEATLYALSDFKSSEVKKHDPFEEFYLRGKYGAVPILPDSLIDTPQSDENEE